ncbi:MAG: GNAT family N-acetyltransferase [Terracidiphilus sp.]|nr:GNAT family N-acetyltransferase [Terracidiphilus sp.]
MIVIRTCEGFEELEACVQLQIETWGYDPADVIPRKAYKVAQKIGGQVMGAFDTEISGDPGAGNADSMVGFVMSLPGVKAGNGAPHPYLHSHMLAVRQGYRNQGLGARLKLEQRQEALARGIRHMEWTFDPLEIKNAYLNIHKLGAVVRSYEVNFYGQTTSRLQGGLPSDRLVAEWQMDSSRVQKILAGHQPALQTIDERIVVPAAIYEWKATEMGRERALAVLLENRSKFQQAFARGLAVVGFVRDTQGNGIFELGHFSQP